MTKGTITKAPLAIAVLIVVAATVLAAIQVDAQTAPSQPTGLYLWNYEGSDSDGYDATFEWNYDDQADGYLLESRNGTSGSWECIVAGGYPSGNSVRVSTVAGGRMDASTNWHFRIRGINEQTFSYVDEVTCDPNADYGYVFGTRPDEGYDLGTPVVLGPVSIPEADATTAPTEAPTNLTVASGARHGRVEISWTAPPDSSGATGFAIYRKWLGETNMPNLCLYWSTESREFITSYVDTGISAYESTSNANKYRYTVYPVNDAVPVTPAQGCDNNRPTSLPSATVTATLATSTEISRNSDGDFEYADPPAPSGLSLTPRWRHGRSLRSMLRARWEDVSNVPGYRVRYRAVGNTDWLYHVGKRNIEVKLETGPEADRYNNCTGVPRFQDAAQESDGVGLEESELSGDSETVRVLCFRATGSELVRKAENWPQMWHANDLQFSFPHGSHRLKLLAQGQRYEAQVAACTTLSCENTGSWSASRFGNAPREP